MRLMLYLTGTKISQKYTLKTPVGLQFLEAVSKSKQSM